MCTVVKYVADEDVVSSSYRLMGYYMLRGCMIWSFDGSTATDYTPVRKFKSILSVRRQYSAAFTSGHAAWLIESVSSCSIVGSNES